MRQDIFGAVRTALRGGQIKSIQYGTLTWASGDTTVTATITSVNTARAVLSYLGFAGTNTTNPGADECSMTLTNATTVTGLRSLSGASTASASFCVTEFY